MEPNIVKCSNCNIVISEVLSFIQNKIDVMDNLSLIQICKSAFSEEDVECAKKLLYQAIPNSKRLINRKSKGKTERDLADIIDLFKQTDPEIIPVFVARDLQKLPPITFDHVDVTNLLKNILLLQSEIKHIKDNYATVSLVEELYNSKNDFQQLEHSPIESSVTNVNRQRGAFILNESSYMDLCDSNCNKTDNDLQNSEGITNRSAKSQKIGESSSARSMTVAPTASEAVVSQGASSHSSSSPHALTHAGKACAPLPLTHQVTCAQRVEASAPTAVPTQLTNNGKTNEALRYVQTQANNGTIKDTDINRQDRDSCLEPCGADKSWANIANDGEWKKVEYRRNIKPANRFIGNQGKGATIPNSSFKAADNKLYFYIYNVDIAASIKDIADYVMSKTQVAIFPEKVNMKKRKGYEAYRFLIPKAKLPIFMDENLWPEGVSFRQFIVFKKQVNG